jgi:transcription-repair coupling factor (superfamily II helicase)
MHAGYKTVLCVRGKSHASSLYEMLSERNISAVISSGTDLGSMSEKHIYIVPKTDMAEEYVGFELVKSKFAFLCEDSLTQSTSARAAKTANRERKRAKKKVLSYLELTEGDYVVHESHGIGQYLGIKTLTTVGITRAKREGKTVILPLKSIGTSEFICL